MRSAIEFLPTLMTIVASVLLVFRLVVRSKDSETVPKIKQEVRTLMKTKEVVTHAPQGGTPDDEAVRRTSKAVAGKLQDIPTAREIAKFVAPASCVVVANSSMSAVDKLYIGHHSVLQLAALGPASSAFDGTSYLLTFLNTATQSLLAMHASSPKATNRVRSHALFLAVFAAVTLGLLLSVFASPVTLWLGATSQMHPYSIVYLRLRALGAPVERCCSVLTSFCLALKDGTTPLIVTLIGVVVNLMGDGLLVHRYGSAGVAAASVVASTVGLVYLIVKLVKRKVWPSPFVIPKAWSEISPFLGFAGPVLLANSMKMWALAAMTTTACSLGTHVAASHQVFLTLFMLSAVALGNPFCWAAQVFLPPLLRTDAADGAGLMGSRRSKGQLALRRLVLGAGGSSMVAAMVVAVICRTMGSAWSTDPMVIMQLASSSAAVVPFIVIYAVFLTLEGALYGAQRKLAALAANCCFWLFSCTTFRIIRWLGLMTLDTLWLSAGASCAVAVCLTTWIARKHVRTIAISTADS